MREYWSTRAPAIEHPVRAVRWRTHQGLRAVPRAKFEKSPHPSRHSESKTGGQRHSADARAKTAMVWIGLQERTESPRFPSPKISIMQGANTTCEDNRSVIGAMIDRRSSKASRSTERPTTQIIEQRSLQLRVRNDTRPSRAQTTVCCLRHTYQPPSVRRRVAGSGMGPIGTPGVS
jgi:hypothetical protein